MCKFDLYACGSINFCTLGLISVEVRQLRSQGFRGKSPGNEVGSSIYMYAFRFIFVRLDLFFAVLILHERVLLYLCAFNIG